MGSVIHCSNTLYTVIFYQVFLSNTNNFQTELFDAEMGKKTFTVTCTPSRNGPGSYDNKGVTPHSPDL